MSNSKIETIKKTAKKKAKAIKPEATISSKMYDELIEIAKRNDNKIEREDFTRFLEENNLIKQKKEITTRLNTINIKISRKKSVMNAEKLKQYNNYLTEYKKELRSIVRRSKKHFGIVENTYISSLFDSEEVIKTNLKFLKLFLKENEIKLINLPKPKVTSPGQEKSDIVGDPVRQYLREMGGVNLLSRSEEVVIAKKIERGEKKVVKALSKTNIVLNSVIDLGVDILEGVKDIDDVIEVNEDILDESKKQSVRNNFLKQFEILNHLKRELKSNKGNKSSSFFNSIRSVIS